MRQIQIGAWLCLIVSATVACGGDKFSSPDSSGTKAYGPAPAQSGGAPPHAMAGASTSAGGTTTRSDGTENDGPDASTGGAPNDKSTSSGGNGASAGGGGAAFVGGGTGGAQAPGAQHATCDGGPVKFRMLPAESLPHDFLCDAGCGTGWLSITDAVGATAYSLFASCGTASCETCQVQPCSASACLPMPLGQNGSELDWNGTYVTKDTCGQNTACQKPNCVKPGRYKAKACAALNAGSSGSGQGCMAKTEMLCAETEFDFPGDREVELILQK